MSKRADATGTDAERKDIDTNEKFGTSGTFLFGAHFLHPHDPGHALAGAVGVNPPYGVASRIMTAGRAADRTCDAARMDGLRSAVPVWTICGPVGMDINSQQPSVPWARQAGGSQGARGRLLTATPSPASERQRRSRRAHAKPVAPSRVPRTGGAA